MCSATLQCCTLPSALAQSSTVLRSTIELRDLHESAHNPQTLVPQLEWLREARSRGFLSRLPEDLVTAVATVGQRVQYPPGTLALRWDESPKTGIVLRGTLRAFIALPDGGQVTTRYLKAGDVTGVYARRQPHLARGVQALEACELAEPRHTRGHSPNLPRNLQTTSTG